MSPFRKRSSSHAESRGIGIFVAVAGTLIAAYQIRRAPLVFLICAVVMIGAWFVTGRSRRPAIRRQALERRLSLSCLVATAIWISVALAFKVADVNSALDSEGAFVSEIGIGAGGSPISSGTLAFYLMADTLALGLLGDAMIRLVSRRPVQTHSARRRRSRSASVPPSLAVSDKPADG